jgi:hypothetical protein
LALGDTADQHIVDGNLTEYNEHEGYLDSPPSACGLDSCAHRPPDWLFRTLARLFRFETGMSFRQWRQQMRILESLRRLGQEEQVSTIALDLGYNSPSAFRAMFKKNLRKTPNQYFKEADS